MIGTMRGFEVHSTVWLVVVVLAGACKTSEKEAPKPTPTEGSGSAVATPPPPAVDAAGSAAAPPADPTPKIEATLPALRKIAADPAVIKAIAAQNAKKISLDAIKKLDGEWTAAKGVTPFMKPYLENPCVTALAAHQKELTAIVEAFAMDDQGGLVCAISKTSDYWQGDEAKWKSSFAEGKGAEFIDKPKFDDSSQTYSAQVSLPVKDGDKVIGAITVGLGLDRL